MTEGAFHNVRDSEIKIRTGRDNDGVLAARLRQEGKARPERAEKFCGLKPSGQNDAIDSRVGNKHPTDRALVDIHQLEGISGNACGPERLN